MKLPLLTSYKDITSITTASGVTSNIAKAFLKTHDIANLSSGARLYDERFLRYLRWAEDDGVFFMSQCRAEMKKTVTYLVHVKLQDKDILETQCECAAGMGPAAVCKHVQALLCALIHVSEGKEVKLELSCTDKLQSFHRPKKLHAGAPVEAANIQIKTKPLNAVFDPRPIQYRNNSGYADFVKNSTMNFCVQTGSRNALLQTIPPANMYAFQNDHDYGYKSPADDFLDRVNVTSITNEEALRIQRQTIAHDAHWKAERLNRLPSSMFGRIISTVSSEAKGNLTTQLVCGNDFSSKYTAHGHQYEPVAIESYETIRSKQVVPCGIFVSINEPFLATTPDGLVDEDTVLEVKCPYTARQKPISPVTVPFLKYVNGSLELDRKHDYYAQVQGQMYITQRRKCHFVVYTLVPDTVIIEVPYDKDFVDAMLVKLKDFFDNYFKPAYLKKHFFLM